MRIGTLLERLGRDQAGMTLVELLVVPIAALTVMAAAFGLLRATSSGETRTRDRAAVTQQAHSMLDGIVREVRLGLGVETALADRLVLRTFVHRTSCGGAASATSAIECRVTYDCEGTVCTRTEAAVGGGAGMTREVVRGISNDQIFSYAPSSADPNWIGMELVLPGADGAEAVTLEDGAALRNVVLGGS